MKQCHDFSESHKECHKLFDEAQQCDTFSKKNNELIKINLCQSLRKPCDETLDTIFSSPIFPSISGVFTVSNTNATCTIKLFVTDERGTLLPYTISPNSSIAVAVNNVLLIQYNCSGNSPATFCAGSFEANFYYCMNC